jgi:hypothetical protein
MKKNSLVVIALLLAGATAAANVDRIRAPVPAATEAVAAVRQAIDTHDFAALRRWIAPRFADGRESLDAAKAIAAWKAEPDDLDGLVGFLLDCNQSSDDVVVCPMHTDLEHATQLRFEHRGKRWLWVRWTR